ncbi:MAG TPA: phospholipid carrier-dependent glycosyltransferase [Candidatus Bathyarchaeia archaeon]
MQLTKRDFLTIAVLCIVFFAVATWNLGIAQAPVNSWQGTEKQGFYIDLDGVQPVQIVYFWVKSGNATVEVYSGSVGNWSYVGRFLLQNLGTDYSVWQSCSVSTNTQYLRFEVQPSLYDSRPNFWWSISNPSDKAPQPFVEVSEIGVLSQSNQQIPIAGVTGENTSDPSLFKLVDEQSLVQIPPTYMSQTYFDEVYFARSAANYLNHQVPHERTHPPLGKLIQSIGLAFFGDVPFGWRIMGVIFATLMIPLMYLLGKKLFGTWIGGFSAAFLLTFDFMHFTMSRMGTADTYVVFFSMLSQFFFLIYFLNVVKDGWKTSVLPLLAAVIFFVLGFSTKWIVLYGAVGMLALLAAIRLREVSKLKSSLSAKYVAFFDHPFLLILGLVGVVAVIYFVTYIPDMLAGNSILDIFNLQFSMFSFHSGLGVAGNEWWSWPFVLKTQWLAVSYLPTGIVSTIMLLGNPAVWWIGFACIILLVGKAVPIKELFFRLREKVMKKDAPSTVTNKPRTWDLAAIFLVAVFFFQWLPYMLISRITYIYHFYINVPILCLASAYFISKMWGEKYGKAATIAYLAVVVAVFVLFYAVISGMPTSRSLINSLKLFGPTWLQP